MAYFPGISVGRAGGKNDQRSMLSATFISSNGVRRARTVIRTSFSRHEIRVNPEEGTAEIDLVLDTGPLYHFDGVTIKGAEEYPPAFLRRYLGFHSGEIFSYAKLGQTQLNFLDSDRFKQVIVTPHEKSAENLEVPVTIQLEPSLPKRLRPGIGYATDTGARFSLRYKDVNAFHLGHELQGDFLIAQRKQTLAARYIIPNRKNVDSQTAFRLSYDQEEVDTYDSNTFSAEVEQIRSFGRGMIGSIYLRILRETYTIGEENATSLLVLPGVRFSRRRYNNNIRPEKGYFYSLETRGTDHVLGSDVDLLQILAAGNTLIPLPARLSLFLRTETGFTLQKQSLADIPPSVRFFAGGDQSVRGYAYKSLGPKDENGDVVGGKNLLVGSIELDRALWAKWGVAAFYDAGNAFNDFGNFILRQGAGVGVRWYTPVGPVKVDLARQIGVKNPAYRLHVSIGFGW